MGKLSTRHLEFPAQLIVQQGAVSNSDYLSTLLASKRILLAIDEGVRELARNALADLYHSEQCVIHAIHAANFQSIREIDISCATQQIQTIVAFGGGKVLDVCKRLATKRNIELIVIPTALSSDCISSPVAVIFDEQGQKLSLPAAIPNFIIVDTELCAKAPSRLTQAGIGDLLSNYSALLDIEYAKDRVGVDGFSFLLAKSAANEILGMEQHALDELVVINQLAEGLILSGLAMGFSGDSRPCSGAEHLISHAIDYLKFGEGLHGEQVALAMRFCQALRQQLSLPCFEESVLATLDGFGIRSTPKALGITKAQFLEALSIAPSMRKGRITFLENLPTMAKEDIEQAYQQAFKD